MITAREVIVSVFVPVLRKNMASTTYAITSQKPYEDLNMRAALFESSLVKVSTRFIVKAMICTKVIGNIAF